MSARQGAWILAATVPLVATASGAAAQVGHLKDTTPEQRAKVQTDLMKAKFALTPDQVTKVSDINLKYAKKLDPVIKGSGGSLVKMRQMKEIEAEKEAELRQALSAQQFGEFLPSKEEMRKQFETKIKQAAPGN
jgi:hypothetical protein